jgi:hypothetical protein
VVFHVRLGGEVYNEAQNEVVFITYIGPTEQRRMPEPLNQD